MSDCGLSTDMINQAIANYCSDTTKELDNLTEELKSDSELEFTMNKIHLNDNNQHKNVPTAKNEYIVNGRDDNCHDNDISSPFNTHNAIETDGESIENNFIHLYDKTKPNEGEKCGEVGVGGENKERERNGQSIEETKDTVDGGDVCDPMMMHSVNLYGKSIFGFENCFLLPCYFIFHFHD